MKRLMIFSLLILCAAAVADAEIYTWTDEQGVVTFTDNSARVPSRFSGITESGDIISFHTRKEKKGLRKQGKSKLHATMPSNRTKSAPARVQQKQLPLDKRSEIKGHLGGDQKDPAPSSMKQPEPVATGEQPKAVSSGMKQPQPEAIGAQPEATPAGMKQPKLETMRDQPPPASSGMEQPDSKR